MIKGKFDTSREKIDLPLPGEGKRGVSGHIAYLLRQASVAIRQELERGFAGHSLTLPQYNVLTILNAYPAITGADLARITLLTPQTVNVITANLLKAEAIARAPMPADQRVFALSLTRQGHDKLAACQIIADAVERQMIAKLASHDEFIVRHWLVAMAQLHDDKG